MARKNKGNLEATLVSNRANEHQRQRAREILKQLETKQPINKEPINNNNEKLYVQQKDGERLEAEEAKMPADLEHDPTRQELEKRKAAEAEKHAKEAEAKAARQARIAELGQHCRRGTRDSPARPIADGQ
jgi:hypothetical protein